MAKTAPTKVRAPKMTSVSYGAVLTSTMCIHTARADIEQARANLTEAIEFTLQAMRDNPADLKSTVAMEALEERTGWEIVTCCLRVLEAEERLRIAEETRLKELLNR